MKEFESLKIVSGIMLMITAITRFFHTFYDPVSNLVLFFVFSEFNPENLGAWFTGIWAGIHYMILVSAIIGIGYSLIYFGMGITTLLLRKSRSFTKATIFLVSLSIILEGRAIIILSSINYANFFMIVHLISDVIVLGINIYVFRELRLRKMEPGYKTETIEKEEFMEKKTVVKPTEEEI
jgi:hypothetical protein